jgi:hypothetical protein
MINHYVKTCSIDINVWFIIAILKEKTKILLFSHVSRGTGKMISSSRLFIRNKKKDNINKQIFKYFFFSCSNKQVSFYNKTNPTVHTYKEENFSTIFSPHIFIHTS